MLVEVFPQWRFHVFKMVLQGAYEMLTPGYAYKNDICFIATS